MKVEHSNHGSRLSALKNAPEFVVRAINARRVENGLDPLPADWGRPADWHKFSPAQRIINARHMAREALAEARK